eukprot:TRINITY_DN58857_c0_g1_i1.p1 TRINITY_DN58857_c0_g1~~TRINITY_DN58857_c0_g1_i1.p1  ORF type:complete len:207 (-),score=42.45 TRINITY_DN58857_c0_g1_i1:98-718(-)
MDPGGSFGPHAAQPQPGGLAEPLLSAVTSLRTAGRGGPASRSVHWGAHVDADNRDASDSEAAEDATEQLLPPGITTESAERARWAGQVACAAILLVSCCVAAMMILREAAQGVRKSFFCRGHSPSKRSLPAPAACALPLAGSAVLCNLAIVAGLACVAHFAWQSGRIFRDTGASLAQLEQHRARLQVDLKVWRSWSARVLMVAGFT